MKTFALAVLWLVLAVAGRAADLLPIEQQVTQAIASPEITIVHFWAPWCPNCKAELANEGWKKFVAANPRVNVLFITVWRGEQGDGRAMLEQFGLAVQPNFQLLAHPNTSRRKAERTSSFLGLPLTWIPSTWIFREGQLRYAFNYGELRFPILQQLVADASESWKH